MNWIALAVAGHLANAVAFIVDKTLLNTAFKRSATYAALIGLLSIVVMAAAPWVTSWPVGTIFPTVVGFGAFQVLALWAFFEALRRGEASRVVPVVGSLVPVFTLVGTTIFAQEHLLPRQLIGFSLLLLATVLLSEGKPKSRLNAATLGLAIGASLLFALSFVCGKLAYDNADFLGVFVLSRVFTVLTGLGLAFLDVQAGRELLSMAQGKNAKKGAAGWTLLAQVIGAVGFVLLNIAIAQGSAAIVNALQAVQYAGIVLVAWFGGRRLRANLHEERTGPVMIIKSLAIAITALGLALVA